MFDYKVEQSMETEILDYFSSPILQSHYNPDGLPLIAQN